jgi:hypothetical protein
LRLISDKVTSRSYNYFLKFLYFYFSTMSKIAKFGKKNTRNFRDLSILEYNNSIVTYVKGM